MLEERFSSISQSGLIRNLPSNAILEVSHQLTYPRQPSTSSQGAETTGLGLQLAVWDHSNGGQRTLPATTATPSARLSLKAELEGSAN